MMPRGPAVAVVLAVVGTAASCSVFGPRGDKGVDYTFTNGCDVVIVVEIGSGGRPIRMDPGATYTLHTLDRVPDSSFVITGVGGANEVTFTPGEPSFDIRDARCPTT